MTPDLLSDLYEFLLRVDGFVDGQADCDHDGEGFVPNAAMRLMCDLRGNDYEHGLLARVEAALAALRVADR